MDSKQEERRGRPKQPYCRDCIKAGRPNVLKMAGQGYCPDCMRRRQRDSRRADRDEIDLTVAREKNYRDEIEVLKFELEGALDAQADIERKYAAMMGMLERGEDPLTHDLRVQLGNVKGMARGLLWRLRELVPEEYPRDDSRWDF